MKVAIVHDFLTALGGAERVVAALHELYPDAPIYTLRYSEEKTHGAFKDCDVRVAKLGQTWLGKSAMLSLPFLPNAVETLPLSEYDIVISSSSAYSKGVITKPSTLHISYCHTPMRYVWDWAYEYARENGYDTGVKSFFHRLLTHYLRIWDQASAERVDVWVANSNYVAKRINKYYRADSTVIYPPVSLVPQQNDERPIEEPYFLIVSRLSAYKKIDLAIEATAQTKDRLVIIGEGGDRERLEDLATRLKAPVTFLGYQSDAVIAQYYSNARAFLFPGEDDFGITPVESMSYGKPVIAYGKGGATETVVDGKTGVLFTHPTAASLVEAINTFKAKEGGFDVSAIKKQAAKFSDTVFRESMKKLVETEWKKFNEKR
jgi:glycosyltransferase involved in cell wall biosynthesis